MQRGGCGAGTRPEAPTPTAASSAHPQAPRWSAADLEFFRYGSLGTEVFPVRVLEAWRQSEPALFPDRGLAAFGLIVRRDNGQPIGFSRGAVSYLGELEAYGINCAACHYNEVSPGEREAPMSVLGTRGLFDVEGFVGAVAVAMQRTATEAGMQRFLAAYLGSTPDFAARWKAVAPRVRRRLAPPAGRGLLPIAAAELDRGAELPVLAGGLLKLFHNMRVALHLPDKLPEPPPPLSGAGRNDAFGTVALALFGKPTPYAPVKYGIVWDLADRRWVHFDGNTRSPRIRNLLAALGLGAPLLGRRAVLDLALVDRHTQLTEQIRAPRYPWAIDAAAVLRGARHYQQACAGCHDGPEDDRRLHDPAQVGTDPARSRIVAPQGAAALNRFYEELQLAGLRAPATPTIRATGKYWAASMSGVWARAPYLHNGSVRSMWDLLTPPARRPARYRYGRRTYDQEALGFVDAGPYLYDAARPGGSNAGHDYGTGLAAEQKQDLIEYLKSR